MNPGWQDRGCRIDRRGDDVELVINAVKSSSASMGDMILSIPSGWTPDRELEVACVIFDESDYPMSCWVAVLPDRMVAVKDYLSGGRSGRQVRALCRWYASS